MTDTNLPSIDGKPLIRPKSKSTDRHNREMEARLAKLKGVSTTSHRRGQFILKYGSEEIKQLCRDGKLSIWRAYNHVKQEQESRTFRLIEEELKKLEVS